MGRSLGCHFQVQMMMSVDPKCFALASSAVFCCKHVQSHEEENNASCNLERRFRDLQVGQHPCSTKSKEEHNSGCDCCAFNRNAQLSLLVQMGGDCQEDRCVSDWVNYDKVNDESCDETLEHQKHLNSWTALPELK